MELYALLLRMYEANSMRLFACDGGTRGHDEMQSVMEESYGAIQAVSYGKKDHLPKPDAWQGRSLKKKKRKIE